MINANATRKVNELFEALEVQDEDLFLLVRYPFTADTTFKLPFGTLRTALATLIGSGDVVGPTSSVNGNIVLFSDASGRNIADSGIDPDYLRNRNNHTGQQAFSTINALPTTLAGYGITDASPQVSVEDEGVELTNALVSLNFVGPGVTLSNAGGDITVSITGSGDMVLAAVQTVSGAKTFGLDKFKLRDVTAAFVTTVNTLATSDQTVRIPATSASDNFVLQALAQTLTNKTLTGAIINASTLSFPQINFSLDAPGDIYFRNGSNVTTRLPIGAPSDVLSVVSGLPAWTPLSYRLMGYVTGVNLNAAAPIDLTTIAVDGTKYIPQYIVVYNNSAAATSATLGIYSAGSASGTVVVTPVALTDLVSANKMQVLAITDLGDAPLTAPQLFPRLTVAAGSAATADIAVFGIQLPS